jgi:crotonobetainyl-CoA:carnitine CoA-transferase CaiB-like acyl-CoA transferase
MSDLPGYDFAVQGLSGLMSITGPVEGPPFKVGVAVTDILTGLYAAVSVLACLHARQQSGHGYAVDLALLDCAVAAQVNVVQAYLTSGVVPPRQGNAHLQIVPYQAFQTADDWLIVAVGNDHQWQHFCQAADRPDLGQDARFLTNRGRVEHRQLLIAEIEKLMKTRTSAAWQAALEKTNIPHAPVWDYARLFATEQTAARNLRVRVCDPQGQPVDLVGTPFHIAGAALPPTSLPPTLGQHTDEVLTRVLHMENEVLASMRAQGIIG